MNAITAALDALLDPWLAKAAHLSGVFAEDAARNDREGGQPFAQLRLLKESGLLSAGIPKAYGGQGVSWGTLLRVTRELAKADGSMGHLYGYHYNFIHLLQLRAHPGQRREWLTQSVAENWLWGNCVNTFSHSLFGRREGDLWVLNGKRPFASGTHVADAVMIAWEDEVTGQRFFAPIRAGREGVTILGDWDGIGQRQTGSGTAVFANVRIHDAEILGNTEHDGKPIATLGALQQQSVLLNVFVGQAIGALEQARGYTATKSRPWMHSGVERHIDDPWVKRVYGELYIRLRGAELLADAAAKALTDAWALGHALTAEERGEAAIQVAAANVSAGEVALTVTERIFEVMGARSATRANNFDRWWRNVRTHTLHNPAEYKIRNVGHWYLTGEYPEWSIFQ
jgi:alkylation response protein AidB-like acyl-CoA dehydrogenase